MPEEPSAPRPRAFREVWSKHADTLSSTPKYRLDLEANLTSILTRIDRDWYSAEEVHENAKVIATEMPDSLSPHLESASSHSLKGLHDRLLDTIETDSKILSTRPNLRTILNDNIDSDAIEEALADTEYDIQRIRSTLFGETPSIANREEKKSLNLYDLTDDLQACRRELESPEFKTRYRRKLVGSIQQYLNGDEIDTNIGDIIPELFGELYAEGWEKDSVEEVTEILDSLEDIGEFCDVLRGEKYRREYCVPLPADRISKPHLSVAGVDFYMESSEDFRYLSDLIEVNKRVEQRVNLATQDTGFFAVLEVVAPTQEVGEKRMETKLERAIDALNYAKKQGVVQTPFTQRQTTYFSRLPDGKYQTRTSNHTKFLFPHEFRFKDENVDFLENEFSFFNEGRDNRTRLEKRFIQSYRWYGDGIQSGISEEEFLKYVISMESMLVPEDYGSKKGLLAKRLANVFGVYEEYRDSFKDSVTELYDTRSKLVHSAEIDIPDMDQEVSSARDYATRMFGVILTEFLDGHENVHELIETLEEQEISEAPDDFNPFGHK